MKTCLLAAVYAGCSAGLVPAATQQAPATVIHNDDFISALLETASYDNLLALHYISTKKPLKAGVQTIVFVNSGNSFTFYKSKYNVFMKSFTLNYPDKALGNLLLVGSPKAKVLASFKMSKSADIIKVSDLEGGANVTLYFKEDKLQKVVFYAIVD